MKPIMGVIEYKSQDTDFQNDILSIGNTIWYFILQQQMRRSC